MVRRRHLLSALALLAMAGIPGSALRAAPPPAAAARLDVTQAVIVAVDDRPPPSLSVGATPRGYAGAPNYAGSQSAHARARQVAVDYDLRQLSAWTIRPLRLRCMLYRLADGSDRDAVLARLRADPRVRLAEPLREYQTFGARTDNAIRTAARPAAAYNDPYFKLQHGLAMLDVAAAQRFTRGANSRIALIDTGVDIRHPELHGRIGDVRDFVGDNAGGDAAERHGTEVAGVIAADADNALGIVGVAPAVRIDVYRVCWPVQAGSGESRCNSFTLAQALGAAVQSGTRIINLSLGGPADPLLERLLREALERGAVVFGALPPDGRRDGFPLDVPGVIAVASVDQPMAGPALTAPGHNILTLVPHALFDYASGSSLATAHASGVAALLLSLKPSLSAAALRALLAGTADASGINACRAVAQLRRMHGACTPSAATTASPRALPPVAYSDSM